MLGEERLLPTPTIRPLMHYWPVIQLRWVARRDWGSGLFIYNKAWIFINGRIKSWLGNRVKGAMESVHPGSTPYCFLSLHWHCMLWVLIKEQPYITCSLKLIWKSQTHTWMGRTKRDHKLWCRLYQTDFLILSFCMTSIIGGHRAGGKMNKTSDNIWSLAKTKTEYRTTQQQVKQYVNVTPK